MSLTKAMYLCLVLVDLRMTGKWPDMNEKVLTGMYAIDTNCGHVSQGNKKK